MFNKSFPLTTRIADLFPNIRRSVLFSMVGSLNCQLVNSARTIATNLIADGYDMRELQRQDVVALLRGPETGPSTSVIDEMQLLYTLAADWRGRLRHATLEDNPNEAEERRVGSMASTLDMMCGPQNARAVNKAGLAELEALGCPATDDEIAEMQRQSRLSAQQRADGLARVRGQVEWIIDNVFAKDMDESPFAVDEEDLDVFHRLSEQRREVLVMKYFDALNKAQAAARKNVIFGGNTLPGALGAADIVFIMNVIKAQMPEAFPPTVVQAEKPKVRRVKKAEATA